METIQRNEFTRASIEKFKHKFSAVKTVILNHPDTREYLRNLIVNGDMDHALRWYCLYNWHSVEQIARFIVSNQNCFEKAEALINPNEYATDLFRSDNNSQIRAT